ncbi:MAG: hypothetical protein D6730_23865 [Bacteroidetes bacterium]|nr:MAG: hypothetical protein D6730_23865 [Bacteroidota bacterium]
MKQLILSLLVCVLCLPALAQHPDSLYKAYLNTLKLEDELDRDSMALQAYAVYAQRQVNRRDAGAAAILDSLRQMAEASRWPKAQGVYFYTLARHTELKGNMQQALQRYQQAIDSLRLAGPPYGPLSTALVGKGFVLVNTGLYEQGFALLKEAWHYARQSGHLKNMWLSLNFFGDYYYYSAFGQQQFDSALYYYRKTDSLVQAHGMWGFFKSDTYLGLANVYRRLGKQQEAARYWQLALEEAQQHGNHDVVYALYVDKAEVLEENQQYQQALELKLQAYQHVQAAGWIEFIARADRHLYETYKALGDYQNALKYYEQYTAAQDSMKKNEALASYAALEAQYENEQKEKEIERLRNKNLRQVLTGIALLLILLVTFVSWHIWDLRKRNRELKQKNREILLAQLRGQNLERKRMATELHDNLNTKIAAIRWQLEALSPAVSDKARQILAKTLELVNDVYGDVRLISHNLMPEKVEALGLISALQNLLNQLKQNNNVKFELVVNTPPDFDFGSLTYPLYNIIFEMINNILKHARAQHGWISISTQGDKILLTVSDDGVGFDVGQMTNGYGIRNITSRLENIQGKWNINSAPGEGTQFYIEIPKID